MTLNDILLSLRCPSDGIWQGSVGTLLLFHVKRLCSVYSLSESAMGKALDSNSSLVGES